MKKPTIGSLRHFVTACTMRDPVDASGTMVLSREGVFDGWAKIEPKGSTTFSTAGYAIRGNRDARTHEIIMRYRYDVDISSAAWIYEERLKSAPRWFKILAVRAEDEDWFRFDCRLVERSDEAEKPAEDEDCKPALDVARPLPHGVRL